MRVIMISTDRNIFTKDSAVAQRMVEYGKVLGELHIIILTLAKSNLEPFTLSPEVKIYSTQSISRAKYVGDAILIGGKILKQLYFGQTVISSQDPFETGIIGVFLKRMSKFPLQIQIHTDLFAKEFYDGSLLNWLRFQISRYILKKADGVRVVRDKIGKDLIKYRKIDPRIITTIPIYLDVDIIRSKPITIDLKGKYPQFKKIVLMASRLMPEKKIKIAIEAFAKAVKVIPDLGMVIVGSGEDEQELKNLVRNMGLQSQICFETWQQDISSYYKTADLFLNTSVFEGYGLTLAEAAAVGCPVLTSKVGLATDFFTDGRDALICNIGDTQCFSNKMITFFSNSNMKKSIGEAGYELMSTQRMTHQAYLDKYKKALEMTVKPK